MCGLDLLLAALVRWPPGTGGRHLGHVGSDALQPGPWPGGSITPLAGGAGAPACEVLEFGAECDEMISDLPQSKAHPRLVADRKRYYLGLIRVHHRNAPHRRVGGIGTDGLDALVIGMQHRTSAPEPVVERSREPCAGVRPDQARHSDRCGTGALRDLVRHR